MKLSPKDRSLILLIVTVLIILWAGFSIVSAVFFASTNKFSDLNKIINQENKEWFNVSRPLEASDLKDRVILLDFWTYACVNCIQALPEIKKLEQEFGSKLLVIGVHSGKFSNEKESKAIKKAILKNDITNPVVNDSGFKIWDSFKIKAWPSFVLLNPHGRIEKTYEGEGQVAQMVKDTKKLIRKFRYQINRDLLPLALEKSSMIGNILNFPTKLEIANNFNYENHKGFALFVADSAGNDIVVSSESGDIILKIGSGRKGFADGSFEDAAFDHPSSVLFAGDKIYIADSGNHALRVADFKEKQVKTLIGDGIKGEGVTFENVSADGVNLASPTDIEFFPSNDYIAIANSGTHQILSYNIKTKQIKALAGNGSEGIADGKNPGNSLAQTSDLAVYNKKLYFVDAESSSLRVINEGREVTTLIGKGLFDFGHENGNKNKALMQHPLGLMVDNSGAYISDSFNHVIRKYDFGKKEIHDVVGLKTRGDKVGKKTEFDEPDGIAATATKIYVADSNNNRILVIDRKKMDSEVFNIMPPLKFPKEGFLEYLPNLEKMPVVKVKDGGDISVVINVNEGWKINEEGPSFINLLEIVGENEANFIDGFDWHVVKNQEMKLPKLQPGKDYVLQGVIYYCEAKKNALCYVKSYQQDLKLGGDVAELEIRLGY